MNQTNEKEIKSSPPVEVSEKEEKKEKNTLKDFGDLLETTLISCFSVIVIFSFLFRPVIIDGRSMNNTFNDADRVFMTSMFYKPKCGDVVIINQDKAYLLDENDDVYSAPGLEKCIVKRVIAVGGQTLDIDFNTGTVTRDGEVLDEKYVNGSTVVDEGGFSFPITVPDGYVFVMGDNREHSTDSRSTLVGLIPEDNVSGRVVAKYYPFSEFKIIKNDDGSSEGSGK